VSETRVTLSVYEALPLVCTADLQPHRRIVRPTEHADAEAVPLFGLAEDVFGLDLYLPDTSIAATVWHLQPPTAPN